MIQELQFDQNGFMKSLFPTQRYYILVYMLYQYKMLVSQVLCDFIVIQSHTGRYLISLPYVQRELWATCHDFVPWYISHGICFAAWTVFESAINKGPSPDFSKQAESSFSQFCSSFVTFLSEIPPLPFEAFGYFCILIACKSPHLFCLSGCLFAHVSDK